MDCVLILMTLYQNIAKSYFRQHCFTFNIMFTYEIDILITLSSKIHCISIIPRYNLHILDINYRPMNIYVVPKACKAINTFVFCSYLLHQLIFFDVRMNQEKVARDHNQQMFKTMQLKSFSLSSLLLLTELSFYRN